MKKATIIYFSGTGNTWYIAKKIVNTLQEQDWDAKMLSLESEQCSSMENVLKLIDEADVLGFGYPIYGSDIPENFLEFMKELPTIDKKRAFVFTTMMMFSGDGAVVAKRVLKRKGFVVQQAVNITMPNNVRLPLPVFRRLKIKNGEEIEPIKAKAQKKVAKLVERIVSGKRWIEGADPFNVLGGLMQRLPIRITGFSFFARYYFVDEETCTQCMQCVDYCPTENITFENNTFSFGKNCVACLRCYHLCPEEAIQFRKNTLKRDYYTRYKGPGNGFSVAKLKE